MTSLSNNVNYECLGDNELAVVAKQDKNALVSLVTRMSGFVEIKARAMAVSFDEADDLLQEGLMGLLDAVKAYRIEKGVSFRTFANVCVRNKMLDVCLKRGSFLSLEDVEKLPQDESFAQSPESICVQKEQQQLTFEKVSKELSDAEWNVLQLYLRGFSYSHIASELKTSVKAADNAMQRVRRKLRLVLRTNKQ